MKTVKYDEINRRTNLVELRGNLSADPEVKSYPNGGQSVHLRLATSQPVKIEGKPDSEDVLYIDIDYKGKKAADVAEFLKKGSPVFVSGSLKQDRWEKGDQKKSKVVMVAFDLKEVKFKNAQKPPSGFPDVVEFEQLKAAGKHSNDVSVMGNLTSDPERRVTPKGTTVTEFSVALNRRYKKTNGEAAEEVSYFKVVQFGEKAEEAAKLSKGQPVFVEGKLHMDQWQTNEETPKNRTAINIRAFDVKLVETSKKKTKEPAHDPEEVGAGQSV